MSTQIFTNNYVVIGEKISVIRVKNNLTTNSTNAGTNIHKPLLCNS